MLWVPLRNTTLWDPKCCGTWPLEISPPKIPHTSSLLKSSQLGSLLRLWMISNCFEVLFSAVFSRFKIIWGIVSEIFFNCWFNFKFYWLPTIPQVRGTAILNKQTLVWLRHSSCIAACALPYLYKEKPWSIIQCCPLFITCLISSNWQRLGGKSSSSIWLLFCDKLLTI